MREIIAILRGVQPTEILEIGDALIEAGINIIEIPLNSPDPFSSIEKLKNHVGDQALIGAGTVLTIQDVTDLKSCGGELVVSPNCDPEIIHATKNAKMLSFPGVMTPSECFSALKAGADGLKFFPGTLIGPEGLSAIKAVLPKDAKTYAVGGANAQNFADWANVGVTGFGIGSALYKPGKTAQQVAQDAKIIVSAYDEAMNK